MSARRRAELPPDLSALACRVAEAAPERRPRDARYALIPWELVEQIRARRIAEGLDPTMPRLVDVCPAARMSVWDRLTSPFRVTWLRFLGWYNQ